MSIRRQHFTLRCRKGPGGRNYTYDELLLKERLLAASVRNEALGT